ncbi:hypothetical protein AWB85_11375 [Mycobacteroides immunogenum]|uniref:Transmembrane protein n=1 Tax=Mycobacteroides immunogenum TaxID=83262 RepID=A0A179V7L6_9MYCO|nr:hypothetical protein [Mycobacteroides immunogenum]OAT67734.1 hypothetical protein AWB85_11375 [Mycobacteroides immunogenum]
MAAGRRTATIALTSSHAALSLIAGLLFFFFVLPRWPELNGTTSHALGTGLRIVSGVLLAAAGVPALIRWRQTRRPEFATPQLALTLRAAAFIGHFLAGVLIIGTAIAEIWLDLDRFGIWEFAVYGAAAAIGLLAFSAYQLAVVAERPAPAPKARPAKKKTVKPASTAEEPDKPEAPDEPEVPEPADEASADADTEEKVLEPARGLRNRRTPRS